MKNIVSIFLLLSTFAYAKVNVVVSILPEVTFVKAIGGEHVNVSLMVKPGNSPHMYAPKPSQMREVAKADIYFAIGVEFEHVWLEKFTALNKNMHVVDVSSDIAKENMHAHHHHEHEHKEDALKQTQKDPHVWTAPKNVKIIAASIYANLIHIDAAHQGYYQKRYEDFLAHINSVDAQIKEALKETPKHSTFMVFHPSWGYFASQYDLEQVAIEVEGKSLKPRALVRVINEAKEENVKAIFTQPEFSQKDAQVMARELGISVILASPLDAKWGENLVKLARAIGAK